MRKSEFARAVEDEFGDVYGRVLTRDLVIQSLGDRMAVIEGLNPIPDTLPDDMVAEFDTDLVVR